MKTRLMRRAVILETSPDSITASQQLGDPELCAQKTSAESDYPQMGRQQTGSRRFSSRFKETRLRKKKKRSKKKLCAEFVASPS